MIGLERRFNPQEKVKFDAFRDEYKDVPPQVIIDDFVHYLGEYRFNLSKDYYRLKYTEGELRDPNRNKSMVGSSERAINLRHRLGRSSIREQAEKLGFQSLDRQLADSKIGDTVIWMSPPGPKSDGYGNYGFVYFGKVGSDSREDIKMTAFRIDNPNIEQFRKAFYLLTNEKVEFEFAEEFLDSPRVIYENMQENYAEAVLKMVFDFKSNEEDGKKFEKIIQKMFPLIYDFATKTKRTKQDFFALENYALELKKEQTAFDRMYPSRLQELGVAYRYEPPKVAGSCGSTGGTSANIFNKGLELNRILFGEGKWFTCPKCNYEADGPIGEGPCPGCGLTKEEFVESGGEACD